MKRPLVPLGAILILVGFFLPFVRSPQLFGFGVTRSGMEVGGSMWIVFVAGAVILGSRILFGRSGQEDYYRVITLLAGMIGLVPLAMGAFSLFAGIAFFGISAADVGFRPGIGGWLCGAGLILAIVGALTSDPADAKVATISQSG
jgi:hypothetical protein